MVLLGYLISIMMLIAIVICFVYYSVKLFPSWDERTERDNRMFNCFYLVCCIGIIGFLYIFFMCDYYFVDALDVYRGKCKLEVTQKIVDGVIISCDSVVVYK